MEFVLNMKVFLRYTLSIILLIWSVSAFAATLTANWVTNQDSPTQFTIQSTITAVNGNVRGIEVFLDLASAFGSGNYSFTVSQTSTTSQLLNLNGSYDGDSDQQLVTNTILQNTTIVLTVVVTVTDPSLVDMNALSGFVISSNPNTVIPVNAVSVSFVTYPDIGLANQNSYSFDGTCSESGNTVFLTISDGTSSINTTATCISNVWNVTGVDVSSLSDGTITLSAAHSNATDTATAQVTVQKATTADISVTKSDGSNSYTPGQNSVYQILVSNAGPLDVDNIVINDELSTTGYTAINWTCVAAGAANCDVGAGSGLISGVTVDIPAGSSVTFTVTVSWSIDPADY